MDEVGIREWCGNLVCEVSRFRMSACVVGCGAGLVDLRWEAGEKKKEPISTPHPDSHITDTAPLHLT